jgi:hypothetical protein
VLADVAGDGSFKVNGLEHATSAASAGEDGEEAFDGVQPGRRGGVKWNTQRGWLASQAWTFTCLCVA